LYLSEIASPGWQAAVNGENVDTNTAGGVIRSVDLHDQQQRVEFIFRPMSFFAGAVISTFTWLGVLAFVFRNRSSLR
jgi:uncharacterized membrane protein YfhO